MAIFSSRRCCSQQAFRPSPLCSRTMIRDKLLGFVAEAAARGIRKKISNDNSKIVSNTLHFAPGGRRCARSQHGRQQRGNLQHGPHGVHPPRTRILSHTLITHTYAPRARAHTSHPSLTAQQPRPAPSSGQRTPSHASRTRARYCALRGWTAHAPMTLERGRAACSSCASTCARNTPPPRPTQRHAQSASEGRCASSSTL